jgi:hypothetical protein
MRGIIEHSFALFWCQQAHPLRHGNTGTQFSCDDEKLTLSLGNICLSTMIPAVNGNSSWLSVGFALHLLMPTRRRVP